jgi:hypothetical protein
LFRHAEGDAFELNPDLWPMDETVTEGKNEELVRPFSEEEVGAALYQMEKNKVAGLDGFPIEFFQTFWRCIKCDIMQLFSQFHDISLDIKRLNYGIITLLPKSKEAIKI